jgi:hypothetical protein
MSSNHAFQDFYAEAFAQCCGRLNEHGLHIRSQDGDETVHLRPATRAHGHPGLCLRWLICLAD